MRVVTAAAELCVITRRALPIIASFKGPETINVASMKMAIVPSVESGKNASKNNSRQKIFLRALF